MSRWMAIYMSYLAEYRASFPSGMAALRFLMNGEDEGRLSSRAILRPDGSVAMDREALLHTYVHDDYAAARKLLRRPKP